MSKEKLVNRPIKWAYYKNSNEVVFYTDSDLLYLHKHKKMTIDDLIDMLKEMKRTRQT